MELENYIINSQKKWKIQALLYVYDEYLRILRVWMLIGR